MLVELIPLLVLGFGLGMLHALDADHVMAVSSLSNQKPSLFRTIYFSAHWSIGHGGILLACAILLYGMGIIIPEELQSLAESLIGIFLIVIGLMCFWQFRQDNIRLNVHHHGETKHMHWQRNEDLTERTNQKLEQNESKRSIEKQHMPVLVGGLHGLAGSAPALALIPAVNQGELLVVLTYLVIFSLGVMLSMLLFGLSFGFLQKYLKERYVKVFYLSRHLVASLSVLFGGFWLYQTI
ncbi:HoxN/HupN/NixA family nickel/cobalt transporter [Aliikangiella sp. IMCC44359]|uniref:HoxN/HupN/NixA family nickel/cobalt transporter n=1 Tax=Aliikangiella sp. IMCC44359 TaxID=3459125 RepID=UPI00403AE302